MTIVATLGGAGLIIVALWDMFHTLFRPVGHGSVSRLIMRLVWQLVRRLAHRQPAALPFAGPLALLGVVGSWTACLALGWALVYWPQLPDGFLFAAGLDPAHRRGFGSALYLSLVTLATLGYGDITPASGWLRVVAPLEALVGFALLTAGISWVLTLYPVLARRRSLAYAVTLLREAERACDIRAAQLAPDAAERLLTDLTERLVTVRYDLAQYPIAYYFRPHDDRFVLAAAMPTLVQLAEESGAAMRPTTVRLRATMLRCAIDDFAAELSHSFLDRPAHPLDHVLAAYAADQLV